MSLLLLSILQVNLIASMVVIRVTGNWENIFNTVLLITVINTLYIFFIAYPILTKLTHKLKDKANHVITIHFILHLPVVVFIILDQINDLKYNHLLVFSFFVLAFFYTAIITWRLYYELFKSKLYKTFIKGSTVLLIWSSVLILLSLFYREDFLTGKLHFMLLIYFSLHFMELGFVLLKIKHDMK